MQSILQYFKNLNTHLAQVAASKLNTTGTLEIIVDERQVTLTAQEVEVIATARPSFVTAEERGYIVALETTITPQLREEGLVRDLTHFIQDMRKKAGLNIENHIGLALYTEEKLALLLQSYGNEIMSETLADNLLVSIHQEQDKPSFEEI
jgi:isoleucyl-tRNA synthetase